MNLERICAQLKNWIKIKTKKRYAVIKQEQPETDIVHCRNHCVDLIVAFAYKN